MIYSTPFCKGNIGKGINDFIAPLPDDAWICIRDGDTMFLSDNWGDQVQSIVDSNPEYDLIGCLTNRLRANYQLYNGVFSDDPDIGNHVKVANQVWRESGTLVEPINNIVAGMFMLFPKSTWLKNPFPEKSIYFDQTFSNKIIRSGGKIGIAQGLYIFHLYRWGKPDPFNYKKHLT